MQLAGVWATYGKNGTPHSRSGATPLGLEGVFVARLTVQAGAKPIGNRVLLAAQPDKKTSGIYFSLATLDGPSVPAKGGAPGSDRLGLRSYHVVRANIAGFGEVDVFDIYMVWTATPGAAGTEGADGAPTANSTPYVMPPGTGTSTLIMAPTPKKKAPPAANNPKKKKKK